MQKPDYSRARQDAGFDWGAAGSQDALRALTGIPIHEFNLNPQACIEAYRKGRPLHLEMFGPDVALPGLRTPAVSYGHVNGLGSELLFPEGGEVAHTHIYESLAEGIAALKEPVDFSNAGMAPFFLDFQHTMQEAFPGEQVGFSYGREGPITTAWELRGEDFFTDIYDDPPAAREFLRLTTASIIDFQAFTCKLAGNPVVNPSGGGLADDIASMIPPDLWPEFVLPILDQYYRGITSGKRSAHIEDLRPAQLKYLEEIGLWRYDPSISPQLNPQIIARECRVPFQWRLGSFHYRELDHADIENFVFQAAADGATSVCSVTEAALCNEEDAGKLRTFVRAAAETKKMLDDGASRDEVRGRIDSSAKVKFWNGWTGFRG